MGHAVYKFLLLLLIEGQGQLFLALLTFQLQPETRFFEEPPISKMPTIARFLCAPKSTFE